MYMYIYIPDMPAQNCVLCPCAWVFAGCVRTSVKKQARKKRETAKRRNMLACKAQSRMHGPALPKLPGPTWRRDNEGPHVVHLEDGHMS